MYVLYLTWSFLVFPPCLFHVYHFYSACDLFIVLFSIDVISIVNRICTQIYLLFCVAYKKKKSLFVLLGGMVTVIQTITFYGRMTPWSYCSGSWPIIWLCLLHLWWYDLVLLFVSESFEFYCSFLSLFFHFPIPWPCFKNSLCCNQVYCCHTISKDHFST